MNEEAIKLVLRMVVNAMAGKREQNKALYEVYLRKRYLYVTIQEIIDAKKERTA